MLHFVLMHQRHADTALDPLSSSLTCNTSLLIPWQWAGGVDRALSVRAAGVRHSDEIVL
jgi:hypothetical protein